VDGTRVAGDEDGGSGFADRAGLTSSRKCGWGWSLSSHDMNTQLDYINDLLEKDSELRDVCDPLLSRVSLLPKYRK